MDDEFELVSKEELRRLRESSGNFSVEGSGEEVNRGEVSKGVEAIFDEEKLISKIVVKMAEEAKVERELFLKELAQIKDLNKSTLSNVLERTDKLDLRIENLVVAIADLVGSVKDLIDDSTKGTNLSVVVDKIEGLSAKMDCKDVFKKLDSVEEFMSNLKILLSQIKPSDLKIDSESSGSSGSPVPVSNGPNLNMPPL